MKKLVVKVNKFFGLELKEEINEFSFVLDIGDLKLPIGMGTKFKIVEILDNSIKILYYNLILNEQKVITVFSQKSSFFDIDANDFAVTCEFKIA